MREEVLKVCRMRFECSVGDSAIRGWLIHPGLKRGGFRQQVQSTASSCSTATGRMPCSALPGRRLGLAAVVALSQSFTFPLAYCSSCREREAASVQVAKAAQYLRSFKPSLRAFWVPRQEQTPLQQKLDDFGNLLAKARVLWFRVLRAKQEGVDMVMSPGDTLALT